MYVTDIKDYTGFNVKGLVLAPADVLNNTKKQLEETWYIFHLFRSSERNIWDCIYYFVRLHVLANKKFLLLPNICLCFYLDMTLKNNM